MNLIDIVTAIAAQVTAECADVACVEFPRELAGGSSSSAVTLCWVAPDEPLIEYQQTMGGRAQVDVSPGALVALNLLVVPMVQASSLEAGWRRLYELLSAGASESRSLVDALEIDRTFGGAVDTSVVLSARNVQAVESPGGGRFLSCELPVSAWVRRG